MIKKFSLLLLVFSVLACSKQESADVITSAPASNEKFAEGVHYARIKSPITTNNEKIVVTEFFWYGCPHCEAFEPYLEAWDKKKPDDVILKRSPAVWQEAMKLHGKLFFISETLGNKELVHAALFKKVIELRTETDIAVQNTKFADFFTLFGIDTEEYKNRVESPAVEEQLTSALKLMEQAEVSGTPTILVNGKYKVLNDHVSSLDEILEIADFLIEKERKELQKTKAHL